MTDPTNPVQLIVPRRFGDSRGWFTEVYNEETFRARGIGCRFVQDNHSLSAPRFTLRGLHFQTPPRGQDKLVRCIRGRIFDVAVDVRAGSPTFGKWVGAELSAQNGHQLFVPIGFAHGFLTLEEECEVSYKCSDLYAPEQDGGIRWDDPDVALAWPMPAGTRPELSAKDEKLPLLAGFDSPFAYDGRPLFNVTGAYFFYTNRGGPDPMRIFVTGGAGFIGSALVRHLIGNTEHEVLNFDKLTYAGTLSTVERVSGSGRYRFVQGDICDAAAVRAALRDFRPDVVTHLAAESHVDRSIDGPGAFIQTNMVGTFVMLSEARAYWQGLDDPAKAAFRFHHISTDEVYGTLGDTGLFTEDTPYDPRSPYSASKAGSDHLVSAWGHTYGLPVLITNCSNNYGPYHFPEKLIPLMIVKALAGEQLPVYGAGANVRDWLYVEDHVRALQAVFERGQVGRTYNVGGNNEKKNLDVVRTVCAILDRLRPRGGGGSYADQIAFVADRPGHDARYAIDASRIRDELGWEPQETFETGIEKTVRWYLDHEPWWRAIVDERQADQRRGLAA